MELARFLLSRVNLPTASKLTGFRGNTLMAWAEGRRLPGQRSINKITDIYNKLTFNDLRSAGFGESQAMSLRGKSPWATNTHISKIQRSINNISEVMGVDPNTVWASMRMSDKPAEDAEHYNDIWRYMVEHGQETPF
jgi:hypothetical protein